eukprot:gnl/MRDRNA2_/MRDRNA2_112823_c0_seq1.p1 gnl/MRDRNA2_/MRDRNA2_112823_c0~~gnl/MRDRNA2_/MRDRNA2_112823_c0_seq1.p1  ORF type:complete len:264 (+),score=49.03 gnl/MRDRNA2_/MRDRNA2_112823_c0_seq1:116-907(+)
MNAVSLLLFLTHALGLAADGVFSQNWNLQYYLRHFSVLDTSPISKGLDQKAMTEGLVHNFVNQLRDLPEDDEGRGLFEEMTQKEKELEEQLVGPVPKKPPKDPTVWEKFAKKMKIKKKKKSRMVYDPATGEYVRRMGYKGANDDDPVMYEARPDGSIIEPGDEVRKGRRYGKKGKKGNRRKTRIGKAERRKTKQGYGGAAREASQKGPRMLLERRLHKQHIGKQTSELVHRRSMGFPSSYTDLDHTARRKPRKFAARPAMWPP